MLDSWIWIWIVIGMWMRRYEGEQKHTMNSKLNITYYLIWASLYLSSISWWHLLHHATDSFSSMKMTTTPMLLLLRCSPCLMCCFRFTLKFNQPIFMCLFCGRVNTHLRLPVNDVNIDHFWGRIFFLHIFFILLFYLSCLLNVKHVFFFLLVVVLLEKSLCVFWIR